MNALIYLRVSTKEQAEKGESAEGYSIPAQREACLRACADKGWNVADEFVDAGESARSADRPNLKAMLARVAKGDIGAVVVHKIDRLARNIEDHVAIRAGLRKAGVALVSVTENIEETASGKLVEGIHALMAEFYSANLATEVRKGMTQKAKQGLWPAKAPLGYLNVRGQGSAKRGTAKVVLDPERALLVREAFRLYATGDYSLAELQGALHAKGLTSPTARKPGAPPPVSALATMLQNPFYVGVVEWDGVQYPGRHKPLIPKNLFERCQEVLKAHNKAGVRQRRHDHYLKGVLYCGQCGNRLSLTLAKGQYLYFYCLGQKNSLRHKTGCTQPYVMACEVETGIEDLYKKIQLPEEWVERLTKELEEEIVERQATAGELRVSLTKRLASLAEERQKASARLLRQRDPARASQARPGPHHRTGGQSQGRAGRDRGRPRQVARGSQHRHSPRGELPRRLPQSQPEGPPSLQRGCTKGGLCRGRQGQARELHGRVRRTLLTPEFE
jgi:site-specific DNA recombinase